MKITSAMSAIVTGGASGLGGASAELLAQKRVKVTIFDRDVAQGQKLAEKIGGLFVECDITNEAQTRSAFAQAREKFGQERILINCAGIAPPMKTISRGKIHDMSLFNQVIHVNLCGSFLCSALSAQGMADSAPVDGDETRGVIILTASIAAYDGQIGQAAYAASKGGIVGLTLPLSRDLAAHGIRVCTIAPGVFATPMVAGLPVGAQESLAKQIPFPRRFGQASEYADLAFHIIENNMLNAAIIRLDGAIRMAAR